MCFYFDSIDRISLLNSRGIDARQRGEEEEGSWKKDVHSLLLTRGAEETPLLHVNFSATFR